MAATRRPSWRVASARASRELQENKLEAEEKKMAAGMGQTFFVFQAQRDKCLSLGLRQGRLLDLLTLAIEPIELGGDTRRFNGVFFQQQSHAEIGPANAPARIDARAE